jgi:hypothetical protein
MQKKINIIIAKMINNQKDSSTFGGVILDDDEFAGLFSVCPNMSVVDKFGVNDAFCWKGDRGRISANNNASVDPISSFDKNFGVAVFKSGTVATLVNPQDSSTDERRDGEADAAGLKRTERTSRSTIKQFWRFSISPILKGKRFTIINM